MTGGFPHSEISGSQDICRLPGAYRRLLRLSSPLTAKASTTHALNYLTIQPQTVVAPTSSTRTDRLLDHTVCCSVYLNTVQLQFNSHTKTLDSVNFASNSFLQSSSISNKSLLMSILKTSMNKLFQLKYILLMIFPAFVRSGNCDKSQRLITTKRIIRLFLTKLYKLSSCLYVS